MSRRPTITRVLAAACGFIAVLALGIPAAAAKEFGSDPSAAAELKCDADNYFAYWYAHLANSAAGAADAHFEVKVDGQAPANYDVAPGTSTDQQYSALDGVPSHITIKADGNVILDQSLTVKCRQPSGSITFKCDQQTPTLEFYFQTISSATIHFVLHKADGSDESHDLNYDWQTVVEQLQEDQSYDVWMTADGAQIASRSGVADCATPPTTTPPTTTPPTTPPTTTPPATTPTTFVGVESAAVAAPAVSPTTTPDPAALPYTGSGSRVLALIAVAMLLAGGSTVIALRRRVDA